MSPDLTTTLHRTAADVETQTATDVWTFRGTHLGELPGLPPPGGRRVELSGIDVVRVVDGRVAETWHVEEMARLRDQLAPVGVPVPAATPA